MAKGGFTVQKSSKTDESPSVPFGAIILILPTSSFFSPRDAHEPPVGKGRVV